MTVKMGLLIFSLSTTLLLYNKLLFLSCFAVTSKFVNTTPTLVYKVSRSYSDFLKLRDELEKILPGNFTNNESSIPNQATILEAFLRKAATFVEIKTSIQFGSFLSNVNFINFSSNSTKSLKSLTNTYEENLDPSKVYTNRDIESSNYLT